MQSQTRIPVGPSWDHQSSLRLSVSRSGLDSSVEVGVFTHFLPPVRPAPPHLHPQPAIKQLPTLRSSVWGVLEWSPAFPAPPPAPSRRIHCRQHCMQWTWNRHTHTLSPPEDKGQTHLLWPMWSGKHRHTRGVYGICWYWPVIIFLALCYAFTVA